MLHRQQKLGAARVKPAVVAEFGEHLGCFRDRLRLMDREFS